MERILVFSDTHGQTSKVKKIITSIPDVTGVIHLGDVLKDVYSLEKEFEKIPFYYVAGNNDYLSDVPDEKVIEISGVRMFITHGHRYISFFSNSDRLMYRGMEENASIVLYGHTHVSMYKKIDGMIIANPGSITYPRGSEAGYGIIEIENGKATYANVPVEYFF